MLQLIWAWLTPDKIIAVATVVYAVVTIVMFRTISSQAKAAHRQADIADRTARAAEKSTEVASNALEANISKERARLKIGVDNINPQSQPLGSSNMVTFWLKNYGLTVAFVRDFRARFFQSQMADIAADYSQCRQVMYDESIQANKSSPTYFLPLEPSAILTDDEVMKIRDAKLFLHFCGFVNHRDVFERPWTTTIHLRWKMRWGGVIQGAVMDYWEPVGPQEENKETGGTNIYW